MPSPKRNSGIKTLDEISRELMKLPVGSVVQFSGSDETYFLFQGAEGKCLMPHSHGMWEFYTRKNPQKEYREEPFGKGLCEEYLGQQMRVVYAAPKKKEDK